VYIFIPSKYQVLKFEKKINEDPMFSSRFLALSSLDQEQSHCLHYTSNQSL